MARPEGWLARRMAIIRQHVAEYNSLWAPKPKRPRVMDNDEIMQAVVSECFASGRTIIATVDDDGRLHMDYTAPTDSPQPSPDRHDRTRPEEATTTP